MTGQPVGRATLRQPDSGRQVWPAKNVAAGRTCSGRGRAIVAVVTFPLKILAPAVEERAETCDGLEMSRRAFPIHPNHSKPVVRVELASAAWLVQIMIWNSGEAELETIRLTDDRIVNKHYDLTDRDDLIVLLDELVRLLVRDQVPDAAVTFYASWSSKRPGNTSPSASSNGDATTVTESREGGD